MRHAYPFALSLGFAAVGVYAVACATSGGDVGPAPVEAGSFDDVVVDAGPTSKETRDPATCDEAKTTKSYVGCDYWPTVVSNGVWSTFDFAVVVANAGASTADVSVVGPSSTTKTVSIPPGELRKIRLPWVPALKGPDFDSCGRPASLPGSSIVRKGAYHLTSTTPVIVYQFNALEYQGAGGVEDDGGPKDWSTCPGTAVACDAGSTPTFAGCFSFSNDASLLLPSTAMTGNYRVAGQHGWTGPGPFNTEVDLLGGTVAITATADATHVLVHLATNGNVQGGDGGVSATAGGGLLDVMLDAGDVVQLLGNAGRRFDLSGSLVQADKPVQVVAGVPCIDEPEGKSACDHVEEAVPPAETLGRHYVVPVPTSPLGKPVGQVVRFYGNADGTTLTYDPVRPARCPPTLAAGEVVECDVVTGGFEVTGDHEFSVGTFLLGGSVVDPSADAAYRSKGDPSESIAAAVEQYRTRYLFLAPSDYDVSYVDVVGTAGAVLTLDGQKASAPFEAIGGGGRGVYRLALGPGNGGAHTLVASEPVGAQVVGYGAYTSYQVPAGLNLDLIAPPPTVK